MSEQTFRHDPSIWGHQIRLQTKFQMLFWRCCTETSQKLRGCRQLFILNSYMSLVVHRLLMWILTVDFVVPLQRLVILCGIWSSAETVRYTASLLEQSLILPKGVNEALIHGNMIKITWFDQTGDQSLMFVVLQWMKQKNSLPFLSHRLVRRCELT